MNRFVLLFATLYTGLIAWGASATMYRCPSPHADGSVVTNGLSEAVALERGCAPVQVRKSALDMTNAGTSKAANAADDWVSPKKITQKAAIPPSAEKPVSWKIDAATQKERDVDRRRILENELARELAERQALEKRMTSTDAGQRLLLQTQLERSVINVDALKRELARLR